jgi:hypothetical protein
MAAKLVVTNARGGSKITLIGTSGTELLSSKVFTEPRGKGATLRSLKGLLGDDIVVEDRTATAGSKAVAESKADGVTTRVRAAAAKATAPAKSAVKSVVTSPAKSAVKAAAKSPVKSAVKSPASKTPARRRGRSAVK